MKLMELNRMDRWIGHVMLSYAKNIQVWDRYTIQTCRVGG